MNARTALERARRYAYLCRVREMMRETGVSESLEPKQLADGTRGYFVRLPRTDDCLAAALATCLQVPIDQVPDPRIDERLAAGETPEEIILSAEAELARWLDRLGLRMIIHRKIPPRARRWIGVVPIDGDFNSHCLVMSGAGVLFDPTRFDGSEQRGMRVFRAEDVGYGLGFQAWRRTRETNASRARG
jgi:hypothetical protein